MKKHFLQGKSFPKVLLAKRGFTLVEFIVYFAILVGVLASVGAVVFNIISTRVQVQTVQEINQSARFAMDRIVTAVHNATSVTSPATGSSANSLTLVMADGTKSPTVIALSSGRITVREAGGTIIPITSDEVTVSSLSFTNAASSGMPGSVRITMTMQSSNTSGRREYTHEETFITTATVRPQ